MPEFSYNFGKGNKEQLINLLNKSTEYLAVFVTIINSLGIIFARLIVWIFYGDKYMDSVLLLQILLMAYWFTMVGRPAVSVLSGTKYVYIPNLWGFIALMADLFLWIFLIPLFGSTGTIIGYFLGILTNMIPIILFAFKKYNLNFRRLLIEYAWLIIITIPTIIWGWQNKYVLIYVSIVFTMYLTYNKRAIRYILKII